MKRRVFLPIVSGFLIIVFLLCYLWWRQNTQPAIVGQSEPVNFIINSGSSATQVGKRLAEEGLIRSPLAFKIYVQTNNLSEKIPTGEFTLSPNLSLEEVVAKLLKGPDEFWLTIPEGLRREEVALMTIAALGVPDPEGFYNAFLQDSQGKEGMLFPDTYLFPKDVTASQVVNKLNSTFDGKFDERMKTQIAKSKYSLEEIITIASLIERETKTESERPVVAGILWKRLETQGWSLQVDASVQYVIAIKSCSSVSLLTICTYSKAKSLKWWPELSKTDLAINSNYNTYEYSGLPPTPIANPGLSSIKAAIYPEDSPYWFYIHDMQGTIHFSKTIEEHNANIKKYLEN
ncbi:hypothetical protein A2115_01690 [Candidatus Woesebacteria bacterium GWA1_41_8]|uniref:Endolytic murein transglycosylase n=1 Tax=Candidatus Woesebacteria bacterium GWA1_41_8 TaxID=1802471 RepID=A0A1F7WIX5_9BACT|nr:MAG: hypothetical protein A2115_01690 [Candidatus Woesebacteria bacterium GWA1_41_8]